MAQHDDDDETRDDGYQPESRQQRRRRQIRERKRSRLESKLTEALSSPALNGGFDTLLGKVERIEESVLTQSRQIADVHEAIYNPDEGLFARIKSAETEREKDIIELQAWRESVNKDLLLDAEQDKELKEKVEKHEITLAELTSHKRRVASVIKWLLVALGGGGITLLFEYLSKIFLG